MVFEMYTNQRVYSGQSVISLPKSSANGRNGKGNVVFVLAPSLSHSMELYKDNIIPYTTCGYKFLTMDTYYRASITNKRVISNDRNKQKHLYRDARIPLSYKAANQISSSINENRNVIVDLSRWMEIFFAYMKKNSAKNLCTSFMQLLSSKLADTRFGVNYQKLLLIDLNSWCKASDCIIMNRKLLTNPLSIIFYTAYYFSEVMEQFPNIKIMIINRNAKQLLIFNSNELTKKTYPAIKGKMKLLKNVEFSVEDETETGTEVMSDAEVKAELVDDFKSEVKASLTKHLLGKEGEPDEDPLAEFTEKPLDATAKVGERHFIEDEDETSDEEVDILDESEEDASRFVDELLDSGDEDTIFEDPDEVAAKVSSRVKKNVYISTFMPKRTDEEKERIQRMTANQVKVLKTPSRQDVERKKIDTTILPTSIENGNPNLAKSRYMNFDRNYVAKRYEPDIDNAVGILSQASEKLFVVEKTIDDISDPMNLVERWTYTLEDERGHQFTIRLNIPKIIDGTYIYVNGSKKTITHQFVLKPLSKTGPDTVQLVTSYNKVFIRRQGQIDRGTKALQLLLGRNREKYNVHDGNFSMKNEEYEVPLDFIMLAKYYADYTIGDITYWMDIDGLLKYSKSHIKNFKEPDMTKELPIGFNNKTNNLVIMPLTECYTDYVLKNLQATDPKEMEKAVKISKQAKPRLITSTAKFGGKVVPLILWCLYCEGLTAVLNRAQIKYRFVPKEQLANINPIKEDYVQLEDCLLVWERSGMATDLLMNGLHGLNRPLPLEFYTAEEMDSKDTYISLMNDFYQNTNCAYMLDNFRDFMIDDKAKEMLEDFGYPTDLVGVLLTANNMLTDKKFLPENNMNNMRIRSTEVISDIVYILVTNAYTDYRRSAYKAKPKMKNIPINAVIDGLLNSSATKGGGRATVVTNLVDETSVLNPVLELEKNRAVTFKGLRGIQLDRAMTMARRAYDQSMVGTLGITTSSDANCGVVRQLTLEPNITSTRGYIDTTPKEDVDDLHSANLFTTAELLTPIGITHDDPDRSSMSYKQTKYMVPVADSDPVLIGNRVEAIVPYLLSDEFVVDAKEDGKVIDIDGDYCIIQYKSGKNYAIDIGTKVKKNASAGFFVDNSLTCDLKVGDKFKKGDILAYNNKAFAKHQDDPGASMKLGVLAKVAIVSSWDIYEDSTPITANLSRRIAADMIADKAVVLSPNTIVDEIAHVGQKVKTGDLLIKFSEAASDEVQDLFNSLRDQDMLNEISEDIKKPITSKYTGEIVDIRVYTTVELDELDPSLRKIVEEYQARVRKRNAVLDKYKNPEDMNFYKAGQIISETDGITKPGNNGKINGEYVSDGVLIVFYIKYKDIAAKGDKICAQFALKGVTSHVIDEGLEPYSEYRPDEEISALIAPLAVSARKVPSIFIDMFGNKLLIEAKRQLRDIYLGKDK